MGLVIWLFFVVDGSTLCEVESEHEASQVAHSGVVALVESVPLCAGEFGGECVVYGGDLPGEGEVEGCGSPVFPELFSEEESVEVGWVAAQLHCVAL